MRQIAKIAGGDFYTASSVSDLKTIYSTLAEQIGYQTMSGDASRGWLILGALLALVSASSALVLTQRLPRGECLRARCDRVSRCRLGRFAPFRSAERKFAPRARA